MRSLKLTRALTAACAGCLLAFPAAAQSQPEPAPLVGASIVFDPSNFTENLATAIQTAEAIHQRVEMIRHQIRQIEWMIANVRALEDPTYRQVLAVLAHLAQEMERQTEGLLYSQPDAARRFERIYPHEVSSRELAAEERLRVHTTIETAEAAVIATHELADHWPTSQRTVEQMKEELLATGGHLEALQSLGLMVSWVGEEVSLATQQQTLTNNLLAVALAHLVSSYDSGAQTLRRAVEASSTPSRPYSAFPSIPVIPPGYPRALLGGLP